MGWFWRERRGAAWKRGWTDNTLSSISAPPFPLLSIVAIVVFLLWCSSYMSYRSFKRKTTINFQLVLLLLPPLLIFAAYFVNKHGRFVYIATKAAKRELVDRQGNPPWGVAGLVILLLVLVSYQSYVKSTWSPAIWRPYWYQ